MKTTTEASLVKRARLRAGFTQDEIAAALGMKSSQIISNIERGLCAMPAARVKRFCRVTGVDLRRYTKLKLDLMKEEVLREIYGD